MQANDRALKRYYRRIRHMLPCSQKAKAALYKQIHDNTEAFISEYPKASFEQIVEHFGSPEAIAAAYVENTGTAEILSTLRIRRKIVAIVAGILASALLVWAISVTVITVRLSSEGPGITIVTTEELPSDTIIVDNTIEELRFDK